MTVSATTSLTALLALGGATGLWVAAKRLARGSDPYRVAGFGALAGLAAFSCVILSAPTGSAGLFALGVSLVGFGAGLFAHGTLTASMGMAQKDATGLALGVWGAVQALAAGLAIASGGLLSDGVATLARAGRLGPVLQGPATGYSAVYAIELLLMLGTLVALGPLARFGAGGARLPLVDFVAAPAEPEARLFHRPLGRLDARVPQIRSRLEARHVQR